MGNIKDIEEKIKSKNQIITASISDPITKKTIKFNIVNEDTLWRAQTFYTKEPITIKWIRAFEKNKVFF